VKATEVNLRLATGTGDLGKVKNVTFTWAQLCERLAAPTIDQVHTLDEYVRLPIGEQGRLKNTGFFVGGYCKNGIRKADSVSERSIITLDVDEPTPEFIDNLKMGLTPICKYEFFAHTTRKHRPEKPRWRIVLPLVRELPADLYQVLSRILASWTGLTVEESMDATDPVSFRLAQVMYWPSVCKGAEFDTIHNQGIVIDGDKTLNEWGNWRDWSLLPHSTKRPLGRQTEVGKKAEIPTEKRGIVGAFCRAYDVPAAIAKFLPTVYVLGDEKSKKARYTYTGGSGANGAVVEDDGLFLYSHHGTDPCGERLVNSFDMVRLHLFGQKDVEKGMSEDGNKPTDMPSYKALATYVTEDISDQAVIRELQADHYDVDAMFEDVDDLRTREIKSIGSTDEEIADILGDVLSDKGHADLLTEGKGTSWVSELDLTEKGTIKASLTNISLILQNDPRFAGVIQWNEFIRETVTRRAMRSNLSLITKIPVRDPTNGDLWSDRHDYNARALLEAPSGKGKVGYGLRVTDRDLDAAVALAGSKNTFHPVRDYLNGLKWDGKPRVENILSRFLGCDADAYHRSVGKLTMLGAVTRVFEPGHKFDFVLILEGGQGKRKSTFIKILARNWFSELEGDLSDRKKLVEQMQGSWILEIPELSGFNRVESQELKAFVSASTDKVRMSYGRRADDYPRQCVFIGSTNDDHYLRDATGARRFWPVRVEVPEIDTDALMGDVDQLWAEATVLYRKMREAQPEGTLPLYLTGTEAREQAEKFQAERRVQTTEDSYAGLIAEWLDKPRRDGDGFDEDDDDLIAPRWHTECCLQQIWVECLGGDVKNYNTVHAQTLSRAMKLVPNWYKSALKRLPRYGVQRTYRRY
jgi:putative DNA primase/helicase